MSVGTMQPAGADRLDGRVNRRHAVPRRRGRGPSGRWSSGPPRSRAPRGAQRSRAPGRRRPRARASPRARAAERGARDGLGPPLPTSATCGSKSRTSGISVSSSSGSTYGGFEATRSHGPAGRPARTSCSSSSMSRPVRATFSRASASASPETSIAVTRAASKLVGERQGDRAGAGADVEHPRRLDVTQPGEAALDHDLRLGPRDQRPLVDREREPAEAPFAEDVGDRLVARRRATRSR